MKLLGSVLVGWSGFWCWWLCLQERIQQQRTLERLLAAVVRLGEGIRMERVQLPRLLEQMAEEDGFFADVLLDLRQNEVLADAWERRTETLPLPPRSRAAWRWLGRQLTGDEPHILQAVAYVQNILEQERQKLVQQRKEADRRTGVFCFSAAALTVILLL